MFVERDITLKYAWIQTQNVQLNIAPSIFSDNLNKSNAKRIDCLTRFSFQGQITICFRHNWFFFCWKVFTSPKLQANFRCYYYFSFVHRSGIKIFDRVLFLSVCFFDCLIKALFEGRIKMAVYSKRIHSLIPKIFSLKTFVCFTIQIHIKRCFPSHPVFCCCCWRFYSFSSAACPSKLNTFTSVKSEVRRFSRVYNVLNVY